MHATLADMIRRSAALSEAIDQQYAPCTNQGGTRNRRSNDSCTHGKARRQRRCTPYNCYCPRPFHSEDELEAALDKDGHFYEVEITVLESGTVENGRWHVAYYGMDLEIEDLAEEWTEDNAHRWGLAELDWDGTLAEAARLIADINTEVPADELRPWRVRVWDWNAADRHQPAEAWGLTVEDSCALQEAVALAESETSGEWDISELLDA